MMTPLSNTKRVCIIGAILLFIATLVYSNTSGNREGKLRNTSTWRSYFEEGSFHKVIESLKDSYINKLDRQNAAEAYMYRGYAHLNQGLEEEARKDFENALKLNQNIQGPNFDFLVNNFLTAYVKQEETKLCPVFEEAKANVEMDLSLRPLDLFVAVDISRSIANPKIVQKIQKLIFNKLVLDQDRVVFFRFADDILDENNKILDEIPNPKDISKAKIVQGYKPKQWTNIAKLFEKLNKKLSQPPHSLRNQKRRRAVIIISDGEHWTETYDRDENDNLPLFPSKEYIEKSPNDDVIGKIKEFALINESIPVIMVIVDSNKKDYKGQNISAEWKTELAVEQIGSSLYWESEYSKEEKIKRMFSMIKREENVYIAFDTDSPKWKNIKEISGLLFEEISSLLKDESHVVNPVELPITIKSTYTKQTKLIATDSLMYIVRNAHTIEEVKDAFILKLYAEKDYRSAVSISPRSEKELYLCIKPTLETLKMGDFWAIVKIIFKIGEEKKAVGTKWILIKKSWPSLKITPKFRNPIIMREKADKKISFYASTDWDTYHLKQFLKFTYNPLKGKIQGNESIKINEEKSTKFMGRNKQESKLSVFLSSGSNENGRANFRGEISFNVSYGKSNMPPPAIEKDSRWPFEAIILSKKAYFLYLLYNSKWFLVIIFIILFWLFLIVFWPIMKKFYKITPEPGTLEKYHQWWYVIEMVCTTNHNMIVDNENRNKGRKTRYINPFRTHRLTILREGEIIEVCDLEWNGRLHEYRSRFLYSPDNNSLQHFGVLIFYLTLIGILIILPFFYLGIDLSGKYIIICDVIIGIVVFILFILRSKRILATLQSFLRTVPTVNAFVSLGSRFFSLIRKIVGSV